MARCHNFFRNLDWCSWYVVTSSSSNMQDVPDSCNIFLLVSNLHDLPDTLYFFKYLARCSWYVVTSSSSDLQHVPDTLWNLLQVTCKTFLARCHSFFKNLEWCSWYVVSSSSSNMQDVPHTLYHISQVTCKMFPIHSQLSVKAREIQCSNTSIYVSIDTVVIYHKRRPKRAKT